ncbi:MAG: acetyltransferase [Bacteroidota bacterium]|nr:acetyltransferase [Bacteroidota bacterium]
MSNRLAIIGSSDLGQLIAHHASVNCGFNVVGYYDDFNTNELNVDQYPILGKVDQLETDYKNKKFDCLMVAVGYRYMDFREEIFERFKGKIPFAKIVHPSSNIDASVVIGEGCFILPGCVLDRNVILHDNVLLNTACVIAHDTEVGSHSFLSPAVKIAGFSKISKKCIIGINATIIDNIEISEGIQVGAGCVVIKSLKEKGLYVGMPANRIK